MERKVKLKSLQAVFATLGFVVVRFDSVSCAAFGALGLNWNNWIIVPLTCSSTCVHFVFSTTLTLYWARVITEKLFSLMSFNETVLLTPNTVSFFHHSILLLRLVLWGCVQCLVSEYEIGTIVPDISFQWNPVISLFQMTPWRLAAQEQIRRFRALEIRPDKLEL